MTIFSKIIAGQIPSHKICENQYFYAFLDIAPLVEGHVLVVPKVEVDYIFNLEDELLANMMVYSKKIACAMQKAIPCSRIGMAVIGLEVPHAHIHLVPMNSEQDIYFSRAKLSPSQAELQATAQKIISKL